MHMPLCTQALATTALTYGLSPDTSRIMVKVGLGFHVEFTLTEALEFIDQKEKDLTKYRLIALTRLLTAPQTNRRS